MALMVPPSNDKKRVKVYELKNNDWFDRGTGFCSGRIINEESKIYVESEDQPERLLLETKISKDDGYQKQQDTLIVWTESNGTDMALSFQEAEGCAAIWEFVSQVQQHLMTLGGPDDALSDDAMESFANPLVLPQPEIGNLEDIEHAMRGVASTPQGRDALAKFIISEDYIRKLIPLVEMAEDLESLKDLHYLCNIMKMLILLNDSQIIDHIVNESVVFGVIGALEYDPDFPNHKANHRRYLKDNSRYKEVLSIADPAITKKIHATWRLTYLKDVVLARILDDPTFGVLNSLIFFNQVDIISHLQNNPGYLEELFGIIDSPGADLKRKKDAVGFIQSCCAIAKSLQAPPRANLYTNFINHGLLRVITFAILNKEASIRVAGTDILVAMIDHDPSMVRAYIFKSIGEKKVPLTETLIELLLVEVDLGVKAQAADAIKVLLEPQQPPPAQAQEGMGRQNGEFLSKLRNNSAPNPQTESFIQHFYEHSANKLFQPLKDLEKRETLSDITFHEVQLFNHLVEIIIYLSRTHQFRSKYYIFTEGLASRIAQLLSAPQKHLKLTALKFFRQCVGLQDEFYNRQITQQNHFGPILNIVYETMPRDNLLNSACLELFEFVKRENLKPLIVHLVETYRNKLQEINYVDTFQTLILRYDQMQGFNPEADTTLFSNDGTTTPNRTPNMNGNQRWQGVKEMDAAEEAYFNTSDDEDETLPKSKKEGGRVHISNGVASSPLLKSLVDYPDDDEDVMDTRTPESSASPVTEPKLSPSPMLQTPPPERLSEKRRREEDNEDDELGKLSSSKRRNSGSSISSIGSATGNHTLKRKKGFISKNETRDPPTDDVKVKKISISLGGKDSASEQGSKGDDGG
ncbi:Platinum sensitivity protein [Mycoblastus sanguinarius]|nr:Platinum sensitivity protein [Mycoblastus sanguinarius]